MFEVHYKLDGLVRKQMFEGTSKENAVEQLRRNTPAGKLVIMVVFKRGKAAP